jgi:O-antigen ligase
MLPWFALVAALGVGLLLVERSALIRLPAIGLTLVGVAPLAASQGPSLTGSLGRHPALVIAAGAAAAGLVVLGTSCALRWPIVVPVAALVFALRMPLANPIRPIHYLVPLYLVLVCGLLALAWESIRGRARGPHLGVIGWLLAGHLLLAAASLGWTGDLTRGLFEMVATYVPLGLLASFIGRMRASRAFLATVPSVQIVLATVMGVVAIVEHVRRHNFVTNDKLDVANAYSGLFRVNSLLFDPSMFGRVEVLALITIVSLAVVGRGRAATLIALATAPVLFAGIAFSVSQTSFAALSAGLAVIAAILWRRRVAIVLVASVVVLTLGVLLTQPQVVSLVAKSLDRASSDRVGLVERGTSTFAHHALTGVGLGGFGVATGSTATEQARIAPHNVVVDVASELGVGGLLLFGLTLVAIAWRIRRIDDAVVRMVLAASLTALVVHGLTYDQFFADPSWWAIAAVAASAAAVPRPSPSPELDRG